MNSAIGLGLRIFPGGSILANLLKNSNHFFRCDIPCNDDLVQLFVHVILLNICKATGKKLRYSKEIIIIYISSFIIVNLGNEFVTFNLLDGLENFLDTLITVKTNLHFHYLMTHNKKLWLVFFPIYSWKQKDKIIASKFLTFAILIVSEWKIDAKLTSLMLEASSKWKKEKG